MNSKEAKDKAYADGDAEGRKYGYGFFERLGDGQVGVIMTEDERELLEINTKGKIHGADEHYRKEEVQYEPSDRGSYDSDDDSDDDSDNDESCYGAGPGVDWDSYKWDSYKCSSSSSSGVGGWWLLIVVIIIGLIIAGIESSREKKHSTPSKPNYSSAAHYYPQNNPVVNARSIGKQADGRLGKEYRSAQTSQECNTPGQEESKIIQSDGGNGVESDLLVATSAETVSVTPDAAAAENVDLPSLNEADWPNLNELREAVESQSKEIDKALNALNGGGN